MSGIVLAWLVGEGLVIYRWVKNGAPPTPGSLGMASGLFVLTALLAEYPPARNAATLLAWGVDLAAFLEVVPGSKAPDKQITGWPPVLINDPTVLLPSGSTGKGALIAEGQGGGTGSTPIPGTGEVTPGSDGKCPPGYTLQTSDNRCIPIVSSKVGT